MGKEGVLMILHGVVITPLTSHPAKPGGEKERRGGKGVSQGMERHSV